MEEYFRIVSHFCEGKNFRTAWSHVPVTFTEVVLRLQHHPHSEPPIIKDNIGKNSVHFAGSDVGRILIDNDRSIVPINK